MIVACQERSESQTKRKIGCPERIPDVFFNVDSPGSQPNTKSDAQSVSQTLNGRFLREYERFVDRNGDFGSPTDDLGAVHRRDSEIFVWIRFLVKPDSLFFIQLEQDWTDKTA